MKLTVRRMMGGVAIVGLSLGIADTLRMQAKSARYLRKAESFAKMARRCKRIDAMDPATRASEAHAAFDDPFVDNPAWNRKMIPYLEGLTRKYAEAAAHPRIPVPPDPPVP